MKSFPKLKINSFRENNSISINDKKKKSFLLLGKDSLFLKKIIEIKKKERNESKKIFYKGSIKPIKKYEICKHYETLPRNPVQSIYKNQKYLQNILNDIKTENHEKKISHYSYKINIPKNVLQKINNSKSNREHKVNYSFYDSSNNNHLLKNMKFHHSLKILHKYNKDYQRCNTETRVLSFYGKKIFSSLSLLEPDNKTINNSLILTDNKSELYRNYSELNLKKEKIYNRKLKKNLSEERKQILKEEKEKEIKQQTIQYLSNRINIKNHKFFNNILKIPKSNRNYGYNKKINNSFKKSKSNKLLNNSEHFKYNSNTVEDINNNEVSIQSENHHNNTLFINNIKKTKNNNKKIFFKQVIFIKNKKNDKAIKYVFNDRIENKENINSNLIN